MKNIVFGMKETFKHEFSIRLIFGGSVITFILAFFLRFRNYEFAFLTLIFGTMIAIELFNSAIEAIVDLKVSTFHPLAKIAKDTASAAEGVFVGLGILGILFLMVPKIFLI